VRHELVGRVGVTVVHPGGVATNIAKNARITGESDVERMRAWAEAELTLPPEKAAQLIVAAVRTRRPRLVITREAKIGDLLARITPAHYWAVTQKLRRTP
jgi:short-subunit dehydrogenase